MNNKNVNNNNEVKGTSNNSLKSTTNAAKHIVEETLNVSIKDLKDFMKNCVVVKCPFDIVTVPAEPASLYEKNEDVAGIEESVKVITGFAPDETFVTVIPVMRINRGFIESTTMDPALEAAGVCIPTLNLAKAANAFTTQFAEERTNDEIDIYLKTSSLLVKAALWVSSSAISYDDIRTGMFTVACQYNGIDGYTVVMTNQAYNKQ